MRRFLVLCSLTLCVLAQPANAQTVTLGSEKGTVFRDCETCPEMIVVPKGLFIMGFGSKNRHGPPRRVVDEVRRRHGRGSRQLVPDAWRALRDLHAWDALGR